MANYEGFNSWSGQISSVGSVHVVRKAEAPQGRIPLGVAASGAQKQWDQGITGKGVLVGIVDSGIIPHKDFGDRVKIRHNFTRDVGTPREVHGTHVAGTIGADGGIGGITGVAPGVWLADYRVLGNDGSGTNEAIARGIRQAVDDGCDVINMSLGGPNPSPLLLSAIRYAVLNGVVVVCAAGNEGDGRSETVEASYPAMYSETLSVAAAEYTKGAPNKAKVAYFSSSNKEVDVCAVGVNVESTGAKNRYLTLSGTSMASPHVAGMIALLIQKSRKGGANLSVSDFHKEIKKLAKDIERPGPDSAAGEGFVTFNDAL